MRTDERHTVSLNDLSYVKLKGKGHFGESFSDVVLRLLDENEKIRDED